MIRLYLESRGITGDATGGQLDLILLGILAVGPRHGYGVIEQLRLRSGGALDLPEGTVYPALHRLENTGLLAADWSSAGGRPRKTYELTPAGSVELERRRACWQTFTCAVNATIGGAAWPTTA